MPAPAQHAGTRADRRRDPRVALASPLGPCNAASVRFRMRARVKHHVLTTELIVRENTGARTRERRPRLVMHNLSMTSVEGDRHG
jgi:hypothetical protein